MKKFDIGDYSTDVNSWKREILISDDSHCPHCGCAEATFEGKKWRKSPKGFVFTCRVCGSAYIEVRE